MLATETEEAIARFVGMFDFSDPQDWTDIRLDAFRHAQRMFEPAPSQPSFDAGGTPGASLRLQTHQVDYGNDLFEIEAAYTLPVGASGVNFGLFPDVQPPLDGSEGVRAPDRFTSFQSYSIQWQDSARGETEEAEREYSVTREKIDEDSMIASTTQVAFLRDGDVVVMGDADPLAVVEAVTQQFEDILSLAYATLDGPEVPGEAADYVAALTSSAAHEPDVAVHGSGEDWHEGIYANGIEVEAAPDLSSYFEEPDPDAPRPSEAVLDTGGNTVVNAAMLTNVGHLGMVSVVMGDWHEVNSIRQIAIRADGEGAPGFVRSASETWNIASLERIDASDTDPDALLASGLPTFPQNYHVDIIEGDLMISNFMRQVNYVQDVDQVVLTSTRNEVTIGTGDNASVDVIDFLKMLAEYDLVIIGGSVYEGNFIEQIAVLSDVDRIANEMTSAGAGGVSGTVGGNLVVNDAAIVNYGGIGDFRDLTPEMQSLVDSFMNGTTTGEADLGADLAFLQAQGLRVLYISGDVYEMNVVSQMTVLDDCDTVLAADGVVADFMAASGENVDWTVSTGGNVVANAATIVDVDDVALVRFLNGNYYSDSMLLQAELVAGEDDIQTFDVETLAPEIIAFTTEGPSQSDDYGPAHGLVQSESGGDGLGGMIA